MWFRDQCVGVLLIGHACGFHRYVDISPIFQLVPQIFPGAVFSSDFFCFHPSCLLMEIIIFTLLSFRFIVCLSFFIQTTFRLFCPFKVFLLLKKKVTPCIKFRKAQKKVPQDIITKDIQINSFFTEKNFDIILDFQKSFQE